MADGRNISKYWKCNAYQWINLDETWVVASHHIPNMSAMMRLPW